MTADAIPKRKLLVASAIWPQSGHTVRAANVVIYEMLRTLAARYDATVVFLKISRSIDAPITEEERQGSQALRQLGVEVLEEIRLPAPPPSRPLLQKLLFSKRRDYYPDSVFSDRVRQVILSVKPDWLLVPWSEWITALCADIPIPKFAYYGNPDHKAGIHRMSFDRRHGISLSSPMRARVGLWFLERQHLRVMRNYSVASNVAANDAAYYVAKGHKNAPYIQNIWIDRFAESWTRIRAEKQPKPPFKIIANIGQLGATANRYGLELLGKELAPALRALLPNVPYELHIFGKGDILPSLQPFLESPEIKWRGFVDDIDAELLESVVFLCLNNASPFKVCHTRYLHAWSLGCCVVAHEDVSLSIPEMAHEKNALLGKDMGDVALQIKRAIQNPDLRQQIGMNGYETFRTSFVAERVVERIWDAMDLSTLQPLRA